MFVDTILLTMLKSKTQISNILCINDDLKYGIVEHNSKPLNKATNGYSTFWEHAS